MNGYVKTKFKKNNGKIDMKNFRKMNHKHADS